MNSLVPQRRDGLTQPLAFEMAVPPVVSPRLIRRGKILCAVSRLAGAPPLQRWSGSDRSPAMSQPVSSALTGIRDVLVGIAVENESDRDSPAVGYGLSLARAAGAHLRYIGVLAALRRQPLDQRFRRRGPSRTSTGASIGWPVPSRSAPRAMRRRRASCARPRRRACTIRPSSTRLAEQARLHESGDSGCGGSGPATSTARRSRRPCSRAVARHRGAAGAHGLCRPPDHRLLGRKRPGGTGRQRRDAVPACGRGVEIVSIGDAAEIRDFGAGGRVSRPTSRGTG